MQTLEQLRKRARKRGLSIRKNAAYAGVFYFIADPAKNIVVSPEIMTLDAVEAWLDDDDREAANK